MSHDIRTRLVFLTVAAFLGVVLAAHQKTPSAAPADASPAGDWEATAFYEEPVNFSLNLRVSGSDVSGTATTAEGSQELRRGRWEEGTLTFEITYMDAPVVLSAKLDAGKLAGTWSFNGGEATGRWEATRKKA
jgi:hypothetical protein